MLKRNSRETDEEREARFQYYDELAKDPYIGPWRAWHQMLEDATPSENRLMTAFFAIYVFVLFFAAVIGSLLVLAVTLGAVAILVWPFIGAWMWPYIQSASAAWGTRALIVVGLTIIAVALYVIRKFRRSHYGLAEVLIGITTCWGALGKVYDDRISAGLALAGGVYIMVRGLDNYFEGRKE